jgi:Peptidase family M50
MIPWPESWWVFLIAVGPTMVAVVILHEAGHAICARISGLQVLAWGVGFQQPWIHFSTGRASFYLGRPLTAGVTLYVRRLIESQPAQEFATILGGPVASAVGLTAGLVMWFGVAHSDVLVAWIFNSAMICLTSAVPWTYHRGHFALDNDARLLLQILTKHQQTGPRPLGQTLGGIHVFAKLLAEIGLVDAATYYEATAATLEAALGDVNTARERLASIQVSKSNAIPSLPAIVSFAESVVAVAENSDDASHKIDNTMALCTSDQTAVFLLDCLREQWQLARKTDVRQRLNEIRDRAIVASRRDWLCTVEQLQFEDEPTDSPETQCNEFLERHRRYLSAESRARLLAITTERLVEGHDVARAGALFVAAQRAIFEAASTIGAPATRQAFIKDVAAPLQRAVSAANDGIPLFMTTAPQEQSTRGSAFAWGTLVAGISTLVVSLVCVIVDVSTATGRNQSTAEDWSLLIACGWLAALLGTLFSILRRERRFRTILCGMLLASLGLAIAIAGGISNRRPVAHWTHARSDAQSVIRR